MTLNVTIHLQTVNDKMLAVKVLLFFVSLKFACCCNGFSFKTKMARNCVKSGNQIIKLINSTIYLDENCDVTVSACSEISTYKTAALVFKVKRNTMTVLESKADVCDRKKKPDMIALPLAGFAVPKQCPVTSNYTYCRNNEKVLNFSESTRRLLPTFAVAAREAVVRVEITHDNGFSCFEIETTIVKS